jgi:FkbM family methyltransferase
MSTLAGPINTVIDVGASDGSWSDSVRGSWPDAHYLLVEAQDCHHEILREYAKVNAKVTIEPAAASAETGSLYFLESGPLGGSASNEPFAEGSTELPCIAIDDAVAAHKLPGPYLIKLDTHGHEREIFTGAAETLRDANLIIVEAYNFANFGRMTFWELCAHLGERGFRPAGMSDPMVRPNDGLLWQMDLWFLPSSHPAFGETGFGHY